MAVSVRDNLDKEKSTQLFQKQDTHFLDDCINSSDYSVLKYNYSVDYKISQTSTLEKKALFLLTCPHSLTSPPRIRETFTGHSSHIYYPNTLINLSSYHLSLYDKHAFICYLHIPQRCELNESWNFIYFCGFLQFPQPLSWYLQNEGALNTYLLNEFLLYFAIKPGLMLVSCCFWKPCASICLYAQKYHNFCLGP